MVVDRKWFNWRYLCWNWKRWGSVTIILGLVVGLAIRSRVTMGSLTILMTTTPCGIRKVNSIRWLWWMRQVYFVSMGAVILAMPYLLLAAIPCF